MAARSRQPDEKRDVRDEIDLGDPRRKRQQPEARRRDAHEHAEGDARRDPGRAEQRAQRQEHAREEPRLGAERREHADVPPLLLHRHDERRHDVERGHGDDEPDQQEQRRLLDHESREEPAVHRAPVGDRVAVPRGVADGRGGPLRVVESMSSRTSTTLAFPCHAARAGAAPRGPRTPTPSRTRRSSSGRRATRGSAPTRGAKRPGLPDASGTETVTSSPACTSSLRASSSPTATPAGCAGRAAGDGRRRVGKVGAEVRHAASPPPRRCPSATASTPSGDGWRRDHAGPVDDRRGGPHSGHGRDAPLERGRIRGRRRESAGTRPPPRWRR